MEGKNHRGESSYRNLNTEDVNTNDLLDEGEDTGIDGIPDSREEPGAMDDNWHQPKEVNGYYIYDGINGTEGNSNSRDARYPDTEDLDGDGQLSTNNAYFEYSFTLDRNVKEDWEESEITETGWRLFRIPIKAPTKIVGTPDLNFQQIYNVRVWFNNLPTERKRIRIATFDFVGNEWEEVGVAIDDTSEFVKDDSLFTLKTYNTEENPKEYKSPPGVVGTLDRITDTRSKEQSIVLKLANFQSGQIAEAKKVLYNAMELVNYKKLRMFVHGDENLPEAPPTSETEDSSQIQLYLRFGANATNYYECGQDIYGNLDIYKGWNTKYNNFDIDLDELSSIRSNEKNAVNKNIYIKNLEDKPGGYYKAVGNPSLKTIRYFIVGVRHLGESPRRNDEEFTGQIWLDEMRLSEVRKEKATALRISTGLRLADVLTFNAQWESKDADFHNISTQFGAGSTNEIQNYNGKFTLDKFLPSSWDLSVPIDARANFTRSIPKYKHASDELTGYQNNTIEKKLKSLFGLRDVPDELEDEVNTNETYGVGTTIKKRSKSKRWYLRYTLDEMVFDVDYSNKNSSNWEYLYNKSTQYKESFNYNIPFGKNNFVEPLKFVSGIPVLKKISDQKLYYAPNNIKLALNVTDSELEKLRRKKGEEDNTISRTINTNTNRTLNTSYKMLNSLNFTYSRGWKSDADFDSLTHGELWKSIITKFDFGLDTDINQTFQADYKPTFVSWLDPGFAYSNNFTFNLTNGNKYKNSLNRTQKSFNFTLSPSKLIKAIYTPKGTSKQSSSASRSRRSNRRTSQNNQDNEDQDQQNEDKSSSAPNPLMWLYDFVGNWSSVKITYNMGDNVTNRYLNDMPSWQYQFGLSQNPGVPQDSSLVYADSIKLIGPSLQKDRKFNFSTNIKLISNINASLTYSRSTQNKSTDNNATRSGSKSGTYFVGGNDPKKDFKNFESWRAFIPDWTLQISGVEKFLFFSNFAQNISIDHGHSGKYSESLTLNYETKKLEPSNQTFGKNWQPLVRVNIKTKWGVGGSFSVSNSENYNYSSSGGATKELTDQFSFSMNYSKTAGFKIPIPVWPFKGKTFKNEINFSLTFDTSNNQSFQRQFNTKKFIEKRKNSTWKLRPSATYRFSKRIQGSLFYERGTTENKITGKYTYNEFGITVNIAIRD